MLSQKLQHIADDELVRLVRLENELAFAQLFERYWEILLEAAIKVLKDQDTAQDSVQEVFTDLWKKRSTLSIENLPAYLNQAIKYKVIDQIRKAKTPLMSLDHVEVFEKTNTAEELLEFKELNQLLEQSVSQLPGQCQRVFRMSRYDQLSNKEIAKRLGISARTVEHHIAHALKLLRPTLRNSAVAVLLSLYL